MPKVALVDYGASNIKSITRGLERAGASVVVARTPDEMLGVDGLVLPGVGAAGSALHGLRSKKLIDPLRHRIEDGVPFLGVCLGMQLLYEDIEEDSETGLGLLPGCVKRFRDVKVPHIGWNTIDVVATSPYATSGPLASLTAPSSYFYFVHSYYVPLTSDSADSIVGFTHHGADFASVVVQKNIWAMQCHPEKSGDNGASALRLFVRHCDSTVGAERVV